MNSYDSESPFGQEIVLKCHITKIHYVSYGRNAYNWTWSSIYYGDGAFHRHIESAQDHAQQKRVQGSRFYIDEIPALAFAFKYRHLIVTEINTYIPFEKYLQGLPKSHMVSDIASYFHPWRENTIHKFVLPNSDSKPNLPYRRFHSTPKNKSLLRWIERGPSIPPLDLKYAEATAARFNRWLSEPTTVATTHEIRPNA